MRILVIEDERRLAQNLKEGIESVPSFVVDVANDGEDGQHLALTENYDLVLLDLMLPGVEGLSILRSVRDAGKTTPILILTARNTSEDIARGLDYGSDDYLGKPFDMGELLARIKALIRRSHQKPDPTLRVGDLKIDTRSHTISRGGMTHVPPALEYRLLEYLALRAGEIVSKEELLEHLYDYNWEKFSNVIEVYVSKLRTRIDHDFDTKLIHTVRGQGYILADKTENP